MLVARSGPSEWPASAFDIQSVRSMATVLRERDREQLSISDGLRRIGVVLENATFLGGPISLVFQINDE